MRTDSFASFSQSMISGISLKKINNFYNSLSIVIFCDKLIEINLLYQKFIISISKIKK